MCPALNSQGLTWSCWFCTEKLGMQSSTWGLTTTGVLGAGTHQPARRNCQREGYNCTASLRGTHSPLLALKISLNPNSEPENTPRMSSFGEISRCGLLLSSLKVDVYATKVGHLTSMSSSFWVDLKFLSGEYCHQLAMQFPGHKCPSHPPVEDGPLCVA